MFKPALFNPAFLSGAGPMEGEVFPRVGFIVTNLSRGNGNFKRVPRK
jgi:hypothetical protein